MSRTCSQSQKRMTLQALVERGRIEVGVNTESTHEQTNTVQLATRDPTGRYLVQIYQDGNVRALPRGFELERHWPQADRAGCGWDGEIEFRPVRRITPELSPVAMLRDLFAMRGLKAITRTQGYRRRKLTTGKLSDVPTIRLVLVGHFLGADLLRMFGRLFLRSVFTPEPGRVQPPQIGLQQGHGTSFVQIHEAYSSFDPVVEYAEDARGQLFAIQLATIDTTLPFGPGTLESMSQTFLGQGKVGDLTRAEQRNMRGLFDADPARAYTSAIADVVQNLRLLEAMREHHRVIYRKFDFTDDQIPVMKNSQGARAAQLLQAITRRFAVGSKLLATPAALGNLMKKGNKNPFGGEAGYSRFGSQTGTIHGGLLYSRTPEIFWHEAPGQIRDLDMRGCYNQISHAMNLYCNRPVVIEPGKDCVTLVAMVQALQQSSAPDAWFIRVSGTIVAGQNTLISSTVDAITVANYSKRRRRQVKPRGTGSKSRLYTQAIQSGIVTAATWAVIQALPDALRRDYEALEAESGVVYLNRLIAADGPQFDALVQKLGTPRVGWSTGLDLEHLCLRTIEPITAEHVCLQVPFGDWNQRMGQFRTEARQEKSSAGPGHEQTFKLLSNSTYGAVACRHFAVGNVVAANIITAAGRAAAWTMFQALNGFQVITDGCTYRRDQIPAVPLGECLRLQPDYLVGRAEAGGPIPFLPTDQVPLDDREFDVWFRKHVRWFLGQTETSPIERFPFEHKAHKDRTKFDVLVCDGVSNDIKFARSTRSDRWIYLGSSRRGFSPRSKRRIARWAIAELQSDRLARVPPLGSMVKRLGIKDAVAVTSRSLVLGHGRPVVVPLGYTRRSIGRYKPVRLSAFLCANEHQWTRLLKQCQAFEDRHHLGLEALAFRQKWQDRPQGSLRAVVRTIGDLIRSGRPDLSQALHTHRRNDEITSMCDRAKNSQAKRETVLTQHLTARIEHKASIASLPPTGIWCEKESDLPSC